MSISIRNLIFTLSVFAVLLFLAACDCSACSTTEVEVIREVEVTREVDDTRQPENLCKNVTNTWTAMVYLAVDNDLAEMGEEMLSSIESGAMANPCMNIVVLYDTLGITQTTQILAYDSSLAAGLTTMGGAELLNLESDSGEVDTGDPETLSSFIKWTQNNYDAENYLLSIVSHGWGFTPDDDVLRNHDEGFDIIGDLGGSQWAHGGGGLAVDFTDALGRDRLEQPGQISYLSTDDLSESLSRENITEPIDILFFHACMMSMVEIIPEVSENVTYAIAGENYLFGPGNYELNLANLSENILADRTIEEIASNWANIYSTTIEAPHEVGVINAKLAANTIDDWSELSNRLKEYADSNPSAWSRFIRSVLDAKIIDEDSGQAKRVLQHFDYDNDYRLEKSDVFVDARSLMQAISLASDDPDIRLAAQSLERALENAVVNKPIIGENSNITLVNRTNRADLREVTWELDNSFGLSVYFPAIAELYVGSGCDENREGIGCYNHLDFYLESHNDESKRMWAQSGWSQVVERLNPTQIQELTFLRDGLVPDNGSLELEPEEMPDPEVVCRVDLTGETLFIYQQSGREGPLAGLFGQGFAFATEDAQSWINDNGGICGADIEVVFTETNYDIEKEVAAFEEAVASDPRPFLILTYDSGAAEALKGRFTEEKIVNFATGLDGLAAYDPANGYTIGMAPTYSDQFAGYAEYLQQNWDTLKPEGAGDEIVIGVIGWGNAFGSGATTPESLAYVESLGITVLPLEEIALSPDADASGPVQNMLLGGANVIWNQSLSFTVAQVIGTVHALGEWDNVVVSGVNGSMHNDVPNFMGDDQALMDGYCGPHPYATWSDLEISGVALANEFFTTANFATAPPRPEEDRSTTYLTTFGQFMGIREALIHTVNTTRSADITGEQFLNTLIDLGGVDGMGMLRIAVGDVQRTSRTMQVGCWSADAEGNLSFDIVSDTFEAPDTAPYPED